MKTLFQFLSWFVSVSLIGVPIELDNLLYTF